MKESCNIKDYLKEILYNLLFVSIGVIGCLFILKTENKRTNKPNTQEIENKIDSLNQVIETLEAIKNGRIEEIKNLNDSATLSLFNELISK